MNSLPTVICTSSPFICLFSLPFLSSHFLSVLSPLYVATISFRCVKEGGKLIVTLNKKIVSSDADGCGLPIEWALTPDLAAKRCC